MNIHAAIASFRYILFCSVLFSLFISFRIVVLNCWCPTKFTYFRMLAIIFLHVNLSIIMWLLLSYKIILTLAAYLVSYCSNVCGKLLHDLTIRQLAACSLLIVCTVNDKLIYMETRHDFFLAFSIHHLARAIGILWDFRFQIHRTNEWKNEKKLAGMTLSELKYVHVELICCFLGTWFRL